jgi:hypothetical protein
MLDKTGLKKFNLNPFLQPTVNSDFFACIRDFSFKMNSFQEHTLIQQNLFHQNRPTLLYNLSACFIFCKSQKETPVLIRGNFVLSHFRFYTYLLADVAVFTQFCWRMWLLLHHIVGGCGCFYTIFFFFFFLLIYSR